jgi:23S rRNA (cytosine1962-C5)-methyltransferase
MSERARIILKSGKDQSLRRFHPWVFSGAIKKIQGVAREGDLVDLYDNKDEYLATGHYQDGSIAVRVLSFERDDIGQEFWDKRILEAWRLREKLGLVADPGTNVFRWVNAEGDGLPGLIIDYYAGTVVMQMHSVGMARNLGAIRDAIVKVEEAGIHTLYNKSGTTLPDKPGLDRENSFLLGGESSGVVLEHGFRFRVNWAEGQKTGFFVDQRENRKLVGHWAGGRKVLNMFAYTGGFSVYALGGGAERVHSVDSSGKAVDLTRENIELNFPGHPGHEAFAVDAFTYFQEMKERYDLVILDPPAFAKHQNVLNNALQGYKRLNQKAFESIEPGGILFTFSCSQAVSRENFRKSVFAAAANARRNVRILHQLTQPADHPISLFHPEGEYLKGLVLEVV